MNELHFFGYAPRWWAPDKLFLMVGLGAGLMGLRVGGQIMGPATGTHPADPRSYVKPKWAARYEGRDISDRSLIELDPHNFMIPGAEIAEAVFKSRRSLWVASVPNSGSLVLRMRAGRARRFILLGEQSHAHVTDVLSRSAIRVEGPPPLT